LWRDAPAHLVTAGARARKLGSNVAHALARNEVLAKGLFRALQVGSRELEIRLGLRQLRAHRLDLGDAFRLAQVVDLRLGAREPIGGLAPGRGFVRLLEREERIAGFRLVAALDR